MEKKFVKLENLSEEIEKLLKEIQENIYLKHSEFTKAHTYKADSYDELKEKVEK
jgi:hypothetical protein